ncbi:MAG TPA: hypothetical protein D7I03_02410 [Candidatus Poseidoniales archaeon]|nr:MAG TPA: hypothetical protein D7I03_02410 [Candidatus Poseidoniales archaeon]
MSSLCPGSGKLRRAMNSFCVLLLVLGLVFSPAVIADVEWEEDGWLNTNLVKERLNNGDEFGCYDIPGLSWENDPGAVAGECRQYIEQRTEASIWGENPISTYTPNDLSMSQHQIISKQGFVVHGDLNGLDYTAWHNSSDVPEDLWDWYNLGRRGGSLEQIIGSVDDVKEAVEEGGLVNLYWIGRVHEATIRHDSDIEDYISNDADAWLTTWGQSWSYWAKSKCYEFDHSIISQGENYILNFESLIKEQCTNLLPERWNVPITWMLDIGSSDIINISADGEPLENITQQRHTREGYSKLPNQYLHLSITDGKSVNITIESDEYDIMGISEFWNNHTSAITIAAHETSDLFKWSKRFVGQEDLVFTWLLEPRTMDGDADWLPYAAIVVGATAILTMLVVLKREGLGPLANRESEE